MKHLPDNVWKSKALLRRLKAEAGFESNNGSPEKQHYWVLVPQADTRADEIILKNFEESPLDCLPHEIQQDMARQIRQELQRNQHYDGIWIVGWTHPPASWDVVRIDGDNCWGRLIMIWLDEDADPQYTVESDIHIATMVQNGIETYLNHAAEAHQRWLEEYGPKAMKNDMGIKEEQTVKETLSTIH